MSQNKLTNPNQERKLFLLPFLLNLITLLSIGFIAGSIVHVGFNNSSNTYYITFGVIGCLLFMLGNYLQEKLIEKSQMSGLQTVSFLLVTLGLSIGVGMISGGLQHFIDFPTYATYLIPGGIILSTLFYLIKNDYKPLSKYLSILGISVLIAGIAYVGARELASKVTPSADHHAGQSSKVKTTSQNHDMSSLVSNDESFIYQMLPHHQEAINTSQIIVASAQDSELKSFAQNVISAQTGEVEQMKNWYKQRFNVDYIDNPEYMPMMSNMNSKSGIELDKAYIQGMVAHHQGAVQMAEKVLTLKNAKPEIKTLAQNIIRDQNKEIKQLSDWLRTKFNQKPATLNQKPTETKPENHDDGHTGH